MSYVKLVQSGDLIEVYTYEREPSPARLRKKSPRRTIERSFTRRPRRYDALNRAKQSFRRLVRANLQKGSPVLLTLTMLDILAYSDAVRCFTTFGRKLREEFGQNIAWIAVAEFQGRGALHFHALVWGIPDAYVYSEKTTRRIQNLWLWGYVDIIATDGSPKLASYLSKYMSKSLSDVRLIGKRAYCASRNLLRPVSITSPSAVDLATQEFGLGDIFPLRDVTYATMWLGRGNYKSYSLNQHEGKSGGIES